MFTMAMMMATTVFAQKEYTNAQRSLRDNIMSYIRAEGYQPSIDSDGDIKFKAQGDTYFVIVSDKDTSPMYVRLAKYFSYNDTFTRNKINLYAAEINRYKMCKLMANDNSFVLDCELYLTNSTAFTSIFSKMMDILHDAEEELTEM